METYDRVIHRILDSSPEVIFLWQICRKTECSGLYEIKMPNFRYNLIAMCSNGYVYLDGYGLITSKEAEQIFAGKLADYCRQLGNLDRFLCTSGGGGGSRCRLIYIAITLNVFSKLKKALRVLPLPVADAIFWHFHHRFLPEDEYRYPDYQ